MLLTECARKSLINQELLITVWEALKELSLKVTVTMIQERPLLLGSTHAIMLAQILNIMDPRHILH